jgi:hypothetical protein
MFKSLLKPFAEPTQKGRPVRTFTGKGSGADFEYPDNPIIKFKLNENGSCSPLLAICLGLFACTNQNGEHADSVGSAKMVNKEVKAVQPNASNFAVNTTNGGMTEGGPGKIAEENAYSAPVKADVRMMGNDQIKDVAEFCKSADNCSDSILKSFA